MDPDPQKNLCWSTDLDRIIRSKLFRMDSDRNSYRTGTLGPSTPAASTGAMQQSPMGFPALGRRRHDKNLSLKSN